MLVNNTVLIYQQAQIKHNYLWHKLFQLDEKQLDFNMQRNEDLCWVLRSWMTICCRYLSETNECIMWAIKILVDE